VTAAREHTGPADPGSLTVQHMQTADQSADQRVQAARSVTCPCHAQPRQPCTQSGDHLARYLHAEQSGAITRQSLTEVIAGLDVIAPHVLIQQPGKQAAHVSRTHTAGQVIRTQIYGGMTLARAGASVEPAVGGRSGHRAPISDAFHGTREAGELEAGG
jgi:hypothetical protein